MTCKDTIPAGVNSDCPTSVSIYANGHLRGEDNKRFTRYLENVDLPASLPPHVIMMGGSVVAVPVAMLRTMRSTTASHNIGIVSNGTVGGIC